MDPASGYAYRYDANGNSVWEHELAPAPPVANLSGKDATKSRGGGLNGLAEASLGLESSAKNLWREAKRGSAVIMSQVGQAMNNNL